MNNIYYTVDEFAQILKVTPATIRKLIRKGRINAIKLAGFKRSPYRICETELARLATIGYEENLRLNKENINTMDQEND